MSRSLLATTVPAPSRELHANAGDPTRTETLRNRRTGEYNARWESVRGELRTMIVEQNALRLIDSRPPAPTAPVFGVTEVDQLTRFDPWFRRVLAREIVRPVPLPRARDGQHETASWIREAYARGLSQARTDLRRSAYDLRSPDAPTSERIGANTHQKGLKREFLSTYQDVQTAANATQTAVTRRLAETLGIGLTARELTARLADRVNAVGQTRTVSLVHTRVVSSVNAALLREYDAAGVERVGVVPESSDAASDKRAEWETAGDRRVCARCAALEGQSWALADVLAGDTPSIPLHPRCRCRYIIA